MKNSRSNLAFSLALIVGDVVAILGAYSIAYILRVKLSDTPVANFIPAEGYFLSLLALLPFIVLFFSLIGSYVDGKRQKKTGQLGRILVGAFGAMLFLITIDYFYIEPLFPSKLVPIYALLLSIVLLVISRGGLYLFRWIWWRRESNLRSVLVVGDNNVAQDLIAGIERRNSGYRILAVVGDKRRASTTHSTFSEAITAAHPDTIIQVATSEQPTIDSDLLQFALEHFIEFKFIPSDINDLPDRIELELFMGDVPVLNVQQTALIGWGRLAKRFFDLCVSVVVIIILSPLLLLIGLINRVVFGKVFFKQTRLTRGNQSFQLFKFQTVRKDLNGLSPEEAFKKLGKPELIKPYRANGDFLANDPRYDAWAKFLRKTSLDELPQLWNVVRGDISLVGPRALIPEELAGYHQKHLILNVKSGITGLAQISGRRHLPWEQRRKLDIYYVQNWTFLLDIQILFSTAWQVLTGRGAQ